MSPYASALVLWARRKIVGARGGLGPGDTLEQPLVNKVAGRENLPLLRCLVKN